MNPNPANLDKLEGGNNQKWNEKSTNESQKFVDHASPNIGWEGMVKRQYDVKQIINAEKSTTQSTRTQGRTIDNSKLLIPLHIDRTKYKTHEELFNALYSWWVNLKGRSKKTIIERLRYARKMTNHPIYPVNWLKFEPEQILNLLLHKQIYEYPEKAKKTGKENFGIFQLHNDWKTVKMFAEAYGEDISYWGYSPPSQPDPQVKQVPRPYIVHKLMHHNYSGDKFTKALIRTIITVGFHLGLRPEELVILKIRDIYFDDGYIIIHEQKKKNRARQVWLDDRVLNCRRNSSLRNWVHIWRKRYATEESKDFLFIQKDGKPFPSENALRMFLSPYCKPVWNPFCPKIMRDWSAIARLIRTKVETGNWDIREVKNALGHRRESTTETYVTFAENYYAKDPYDWLRAVLKFHIRSKERPGTTKQVVVHSSEPIKNKMGQKIKKRRKKAFCERANRRKINAPVGE
jgi:integrase